ncbi:ABC transporter ATP-binding protein [Streptococcus suis]|uniref:ABC transporter ATP-binding protein n=1 Tax=Streptococcus suis TaxID=1307 RepID=UPI000F63A095|nr:ABC transporter ATP-binding protein [Streptococcus suis]RRR54945.1 ABC transporter ATP-binding protein [Streptococcus suis]
MEKLRIVNLKKNYGNFEAVHDVSFELHRGECIGILGINGAGKSSILKMIYSATSITSGAVFIDGKDITENRAESKSKLGIVTQDDMLDSTLTVLENLIAHGICYDISKQDVQKRALELLKFVNLEGHQNKKIGELSGGMRRRVSLARALLNNPEIIILDEPTVGLDIQSRNIIWDKLQELKDRGIAIIITSHYMNEIEKLSDRILIIHSGIVSAEGTVSDLFVLHKQSNLEDLFLKLTKSNREEERYNE